MSKSPHLLSHSRSSLLIVDIQQKLVPVIPNGPELLELVKRLSKGADLFGVPISVTEQYPQGLGPTVVEFDDLSCPPNVFTKTTFSCRENMDHFRSLRSNGRDQIVLCGIEAHICVLQSALDLKNAGFSVFLVADAVGSRQDQNKDWAIQRCMQNGVTVLPAESVLFEWCEDSQDDRFKSISKLVR